MSDQPLTEAASYTTHTHSGIRTRDTSNEAAGDRRLKPKGHRDRPCISLV
jgi:hypothetical protein